MKHKITIKLYIQIITGQTVLSAVLGTLVWFRISDEDVACHLSFPNHLPDSLFLN